MAKSTPARAIPAAIRHQQYQQQRAMYERIVGDCARTTHARMYREFAPLFLYYRPSGDTTYGVLHAFSETETVPELAPPAAPWILVTPEAIPRNATAEQLYVWIKRLSDTLPMYPSKQED